MKVCLMAIVMAALLSSGVASAAEKSPQQQKMSICNQHAGAQNLKGEARKSFMRDCLKKDSKTSKMSPQQMKMKSCNGEAANKKLAGDARKNFMSQCLKKG